VESPTLAHLDRSCNHMETGGTERLTELLVQCRALSHLDFSDHAIGDVGAKSITGMLGKYEALVHLNITTTHLVSGSGVHISVISYGTGH
jgi:hypothetical protein